MKVRNNLNSGITLSLADKALCTLPVGKEITIEDKLLTDEFTHLAEIGYIVLIKETSTVEDEVPVEAETTSAKVKTTRTSKNK